jgi:dipeptidase
MCDTVAVVTGQGTWFAKNSDREAGEAQLVERIPRRRASSRTVKCTHVEVPAVDETYAVILSRPFWMWGAEMGVNEKGVAIGNEAVFTTEKLDDTGLTGMDMLRLALERASSAREAVDVVTALLAAHGQGGRMGYRNTRFSYASSFLITDASEAWVLETAGRRWAAERVTSGTRSISNALSIEEATIADGKSERAFARAYDDAWMSTLSGGRIRRACTAAKAGPSFEAMAAALRDHAGHHPRDGLVIAMPCAHASLLPTRAAGQSTASMIVESTSSGPRVWMTGTSSPCLSVFKRVPFTLTADDDLLLGPAPGAGYDDKSLFWAHERLHRRVLVDWERSSGLVRARADALEASARDDETGSAWREHRARIDAWLADLPPPSSRWSPFGLYWRRQSKKEGMPA